MGLRALPIARLKRPLAPDNAGELVSRGAQSEAIRECVLVALLLASSSASLGLMREAHRLALAYARQRYQGGKLISEHSCLQHILGNLSASVIAGEHQLAAASQQASLSAALAAKVTIGEDAVSATIDAVQILGGYGYMSEYGLEKSMRDAATLSLVPFSNWRARLLLNQRDCAHSEIVSGRL